MPRYKTIIGTDLETTGFFEPEHRIIEAFNMEWRIDLDNPTDRVLINETLYRIDPERTIPPKSTEVHRITAADLIGKPNFKAVAPAFVAELNKADIVVAHNGMSFDFPFIIQECERVGHSIPDFEPFDTMTEGRFATPFGKVPNMQELCFACRVEYDADKAHAAKYDVEKMMECLFFGLELGWYNLDG